jgi:predicted peptidase
MIGLRFSRAVWSVLLIAAAGCGGPKTGFLTRTLRTPDGQEARYTVFVPHANSSASPLPVILFLHGGGEAGTDGRRPSEVGLGPAIRAREDFFPFVVIFPQAQEFVPAMFGSWNLGRPDGNRALAILDAVQREFHTDPHRVSLTGISVGGYGVWQVASSIHVRWAAIVPVCGRATLKHVEELARIPCWCFHGADDEVVSVEESRRMVKALKAAGGSPRYTEYAGVGHNCWDKAYATDELYALLLSQRR